ncbi:ImmA/IrrE family metallo-endopeptidase [uncultured Ruegeria sp.]|uniref:ImmA/IrrE family metallo-endopeptidase n=1 Tax=uncultured Ruegeria sp. TaxID=259304 RepID=UPI0026059FB9|nr:ImmA/IrrE family metallo-endopeptidase [uncultured Ruegeria sp.]
MSTTEKGNRLEDNLYDYLLDQINRDELVFDAHPPSLCEVHKKKKYYCKEREANVEFDVVVEVRRKTRPEPHLYVVFECKNHKKPVEDMYVRNFSDQLRSVFGQAVKGIMVTSSRLQSGAESVATNRRLGIVKFDENGIDVIADRAVGSWAEKHFIKKQISDNDQRSKSLKFSAIVDGKYFGSFDQMLHSFGVGSTDASAKATDTNPNFIKFLPESEIQSAAHKALSMVDYDDGEVNVEKLCQVLNLDLSYSERAVQDEDGNTILGSANFVKRSIEIYQNDNRNRERFTVAHEIGHFLLLHCEYLRSESIVERDLYIDAGTDEDFNYERLEYQANLFASLLLLPEVQFRNAVGAQRQTFKTYGRGFGYIFVDDQPCNLAPYNQMLAELSYMFGVSKQAIEIRLKREGLVTDDRR